MRFVRLVGAIGIVLAMLFTSLAGGRDGPAPAMAPADGPVALLDTYVMNPAGYLAAGAKVLNTYGNGYLLVRLPAGIRLSGASLRGVDLMPDRTNIDLYYSGVKFNTQAGAPAFPAGLQPASVDAYLIQFLGPLDPTWIRGLEAKGLHFEQYLATFTYVVTGGPDAIAAAKASPYVGWVSPYVAGYKVSPDLLKGTGAVQVSIIGFDGASPMAMASRISMLGGALELAWYNPPTVVAMVPVGRIAGVARLADVMYIQEYGTPKPLDNIAGQIHHYQDGWETAKSGLPSTLTGRSPGPDGIMYNADDYFEGAGIEDTGFDEGDPNQGALDFFASPNGDRVIRFQDHTGFSRFDGQYGGVAHGTHVAGIIAADGYSWEKYLIENAGDSSVSTTDKDWSKSEAGVAPEAKIAVDGIVLTSGSLSPSPTYWDCQYLNGYTTVVITAGVSAGTCGSPWIDDVNVATHNTAIDAGSRTWVDVHSNSWGSTASGYGATAAAADARMNAAPDRLIVFAAGNGGPGPNTVSNEALLKNGLSVGASDNFRPDQFESDNPNLMAGFSSRGGPTQSNGRIKPDIVAVGTSVLSLFARGETLNGNYVPGQAGLVAYVDKYCSLTKTYCATGDGIADYRYLQGTSMAAPHAAGMAMIVREYLREVGAGNNPGSPYFNPPNYLVKAMMINGAVRMDPNLYTYPGYDQGWGRIDLQQSLFPPVPRTNQFATATMSSPTTWTPTGMNLNVAKGDVPLKVTLTWLDVQGDGLNRNLDLRVISPGGNEYHGNQYTNGWSDPTKGSYDIVNNVEQVEVQSPETGAWTVEVRGVSVATPAPFALVFSADVGPSVAYKVDLSTTYPTAVSLAPSGSATIPFKVLNYGTNPDTVLLTSTSPADISVSFLPSNLVDLASGQSEDRLAVITASAVATPGVKQFDIRGTSQNDTSSTPASDFIGVRAEVLGAGIPYALQVTNATVDELDPSVLTFDDPVAGRHIFIAYRKTSAVSPNGLTGGVNVWVAHATVDATTGLPNLPFTQTMVSNTNEDPNDLRLVRFTAGGLKNRVAVTWTGSDPAETNADAQSWARVGYLDPPYTGSWSVVMIEKNEGTASPCNIARVSFPLFRAAVPNVNGQLIYVWETLAYASGCQTQTAVVSSAKVSLDGGATWNAAQQVFPPPGNANYYFFPNGVVDQNDVAWVFCYWRTPTGNNRKLTVRLFDNAGWSPFPVNDYTIFSEPYNSQWPAALSTAEGGNRVYVTWTRDLGGTDLKMFLAYATGTYSSAMIPADYRTAGFSTPCAGCQLSADFSLPNGSGLKGPYGTSVSSANYNRRPILNIVQTNPDGIVWLPYMENANAYGTPNLWTRYSGDQYATTANTIVTSDAFAKGHQMSSTLTEGGTGRVYEVFHSSRGTVTQVNYDVFLLIYFTGWPTAIDRQGPLVTSVGGTPNPVNKTSTFRVTANVNDITTGNHTIAMAEYSIDAAAPPGSGIAMTPIDGAFDTSIEAAVATVDVGALGWGDNECHLLFVRGQDSVGNWGQPSSFQECTERGSADVSPPVAPVLTRTQLAPSINDVTLIWNKAIDEGAAGGTTHYRVYRGTGLLPTWVQVADIPGTNNATYQWTDSGHGDGDANLYQYKVRSVDAANNEAQSLATGGKFTRPVTAGWNLLSVPVLQTDTSVAATLGTLSISRARTYIASDATDPWKEYVVVKGLQDFRTVDIGNAIWVNVNGADSFTVAGLIPSSTQINLVRGWNFVGFPSWRSTPYTVLDLKNATSAVTDVEGFDGINGPYYVKHLVNTDVFAAGFGYWIWSTAPAQWIVP